MTRFAPTWDPWRELEQLRGEMNRLFADWRRPTLRRSAEFPPVNVWHNEQSLILTAEIPGADPDALDLTVAGNSVVISGRRKAEAVAEGQNFHRRERWSEPFSRTVELPVEVDPEQTEASYELGVLTLKLQRPKEQQPKKINVKGV
jgi:HSP20 family protein